MEAYSSSFTIINKTHINDVQNPAIYKGRFLDLEDQTISESICLCLGMCIIPCTSKDKTLSIGLVLKTCRQS